MNPESSNEESSLDPNLNETKNVWGFWASIGFGLLIGVATTIIQVILMMGFMAAADIKQGGDFDSKVFGESIEMNGNFLGVATIGSLFVVIPIIFGIVKLRKGAIAMDYLALKSPSLSTLLKLCGIIILFVVALDTITFLIGRDVVPEFMKQVYGSADSKLLLCVAIVIAAPLVEEFIFRGFLFAGFVKSRLGPAGTVILTSILWALMHMQYDWVGILYIFLMGILLGVVRLKTESVWGCVMMHGLANTIATIEVVLVTANV